MEFFGGFLSGIAFTYILGMIVTWYAQKRIAQLKEALVLKLEERSKIVTVDIVGDQMFAYDKTTNQFLCKFDNFNDLNESLTKLSPTTLWHMDADHYPAVVKHIEYLKAKNGQSQPL